MHIYRGRLVSFSALNFLPPFSPSRALDKPASSARLIHIPYAVINTPRPCSTNTRSSTLSHTHTYTSSKVVPKHERAGQPERDLWFRWAGPRAPRTIGERELLCFKKARRVAVRPSLSLSLSLYIRGEEREREPDGRRRLTGASRVCGYIDIYIYIYTCMHACEIARIPSLRRTYSFFAEVRRREKITGCRAARGGAVMARGGGSRGTFAAEACVQLWRAAHLMPREYVWKVFAWSMGWFSFFLPLLLWGKYSCARINVIMCDNLTN